MHTYTQKLDHFNDSDTRVFQQRYNVIDTYYKSNGPIFLFLAGEAMMEFFQFQTVQIRENWAKQHNALYISLEHRYYGDSIPFPANETYSTKNIKFLSSVQALEDAASFIQSYNKNMSTTSPWVTFGCSYSAGLAAWFRSKYSSLTVGAVCPSGPVVATLNYTSFFGQFSNSAAPACVERTQIASQMIETMSKTTNGLQKLGSIFKACKPLDMSNRYYFLWTLMSVVGSADQMSNPPTWGLNVTCNLLVDNTTDPINAFYKAFEYQLQNPDAIRKNLHHHQHIYKAIDDCNDFDEITFIMQLQASDNAGRAWWYQKCTEFGYFKGGYEGTSVFFNDLNVEHIVSYCEKIFNIPNMTPHIEQTNNYYGGKNLKGSNILFTNGLLDPWHLLSITTPEQNVNAVNYEAGHCGTLIQSSSLDPPSLINARNVVASTLNEWLQ